MGKYIHTQVRKVISADYAEYHDDLAFLISKIN
jgi:hypothetical protein